MNPVQLLDATAGMTPSGTGSYFYVGNYSVVLDNMAYHKVVGVWGRQFGTGVWSFYPCHYRCSVPGNKEIWDATIFDELDQFVMAYEVAGQHYWDNNAGHNYLLDVEAARRVDGAGTAVIGPPLIGESSGSINSGELSVYVAVQNLDYHKRVGIVYTTDRWQTWNNAFGSYLQSYPPGPLPAQAQVETWVIQTPVVAQRVEYAIFYIVMDNTYWDNNFGRNYVAQAYTVSEAAASEAPEQTARRSMARAAVFARTTRQEQESA